MRNVDLSILLNLVSGVDGYEVSRFGESIHVHPNRIKLAGSQRQTHNEIHAYVIPLLVRNTQWLQQSSMFHVVGLYLPVGITLRQIGSYLMFHSCPPELLPQILIHLGTTQMNRVPRSMSFIKNFLFEASFFGTRKLSLNHIVPSASSRKQASFGSLSHILLLIYPMTLSCFCAAMISHLKVGVRVMLNNNKSGNTRVPGSSLLEQTTGK
jgi:hypothetical protein